MTHEAAVAAREHTKAAPPPLEILIVDDDPVFRLMLRRMLMRGAATRVVEAQHAGEAIALIERHRPDLVVSDIFMPVADGFELLNWMRSHAADVPVLVVSAAGHADAHFDPAVIAQHLGAAEVLSKPFDRADLVAAVDRALAR
ncbi:response regulator [Dongia sp.]|uniref:response regulator n=1 Tax=Dongia sp. TaxID=1977262 RepID=UPI003753A6B6